MPENMMISAKYGSWKSPISIDMICSGAIAINSVALSNNFQYWLQARPADGGISLMRRDISGAIQEIVAAPYNVRSRVHEYGGGAYLIADNTIYFSNFSDNVLYSSSNGSITPVTIAGTRRYADFVMDPSRNRLIAVCEDHANPSREAQNFLVGIDLSAPNSGTILAEGWDFYSTPRLSPDGSKIVFLTWRHPNMPWDGTHLWMADIQHDGTFSNLQEIAGDNESIFQPSWSPDGKLYFVSDRSGWWNLYTLKNDGALENILPMNAEFGVPQWVFGMETYTFLSAKKMLVTYIVQGESHFATLDLETKTLTQLPAAQSVNSFAVFGEHVLFTAADTAEPNALYLLDLQTNKTETILKTTPIAIEPAYVSRAQSLEYPTENGKTAFAFYYPPQNPEYTPLAGELPPLLVKCHGGPVSAARSSLSLGVQFWTSRGFAVLDVNYGGSTGYGREYRDRLLGQWGVVDLQDSVNGVRYLTQAGLADPKRVFITGGSAGGYTVLCALTFTDVFTAGTSYFGVSDLELLKQDSHKFESHDIDMLVGTDPQLFIDRSPIHHTDKIHLPTLLLQGLDDKVVPPNQTQKIEQALLEKGVPVAALYFTGEGHGFRKAENNKKSFEAELSFYAQIGGFTPGDDIPELRIENLTKTTRDS